MKSFLISLFILPLLFSNAFAESTEDIAADMAGINQVEDALPPDGRDISGELKIDGSYDVRSALKRLWDSFINKAEDGLRDEFGFFLSLLCIAFFCALASALCSGGQAPEYINIAGCCASAYLISGSVQGIMNEAVQALYSLSDYSRAAMPAIFTAAAACGAVGSAPLKYAAACMSIEIFMSVARALIIPFISAFTAISLSASIFDNALLRSASKLFKSVTIMLMTGLCLAFSAYISISGLIAGSTDAIAVKTAKTLISNSLPVVGGIISDAASVVLASASLIKNSAGVFSLVAVAALCAGPFALLSVKMLLFKAAAAAADMLPGGRISTLLSSMSAAMAMLMGLVGSMGIMLFISFMAGIRVVNL